MKTFLKTLIGGALGAGALYIVGKICYEAGKEVAEVERQLEKSNAEAEKPIDIPARTNDGTPIHINTAPDVTVETSVPVGDAEVERTSSGGWVGKVRNAKVFLAAKRAFSKKDRKQGILGSLLTNPDGAKIEAVVRDGGVQICVKPRAA